MLISQLVAVVAAGLPTGHFLPAADAAAVRAAVYGEFPKTGLQPGDVAPRLAVPQVVTAAYLKNPSATLSLLSAIATGAAPQDSILAVGYFLELAVGAGSGELITSPEFYNREAYDMPDRFWKCTPREHWVRVLRKEISKLSSVASK